MSVVAYTMINGANNTVTVLLMMRPPGVAVSFSEPVSMVVRGNDNLINTHEENQHCKRKIDKIYRLQVGCRLGGETAEMKQNST